MRKGRMALFSVLGAFAVAAGVISDAAAQMPNICPPGQTFVIAQGKCVATPTQQPAVNCPTGQQYDAQTNRCVTASSAVRCPEGQEYDSRANRCVTIRCPQGQRYDAATNRCL
jgi:hypothetical protein